MANNNFDILIIGGSFAGLTTSLALAQISSNIKIAIVEKTDIKNNNRQSDGRGYAISSSSLKFFQEIGIYDRLQENAGKIEDIKISDSDSPFILDFFGSQVDKKNKQLGQIIESYHIHNALRDKVLQTKNITIFCPHSYKEVKFEDCCKIILNNNQELHAKLILACDGRFSKLREKFQIHTIVKKYQQTAIVFDIEHQNPHNNVAYEKFYNTGPLAILPLKQQNKSSIVWIVQSKDLEAYLALDELNFINQLSKKINNDVGKIKNISQKFSYPLTLVEASQFYHQKMLLIGDAACGVHPIAGQGFNLAISSIQILQKLIKENLLNGLDLDSQNLIDQFNSKARFNCQKMAIATDILNSLFENKNITLSISRKIGLSLVNKIPKLKKIFIKSAGGC